MTMAAGFELFLDALRLLWQRRAEALPVFVVPLGVLTVLEIAAFTAVPADVWFAVLYFAAWYIIPAWIAVFWHRYILLDETPSGLLPPWQNSLVFPYMFVGFFIALLMGAIIFIPAFLPFIIFPEFGENGLFVGAFFAIASVLCLYLLFRFGLILPHLALGRRWLSFGESWRQTSGMRAGLWVIAVLNALVISPPILLPSVEAGPGSMFITLISALTVIIGTMIGISLLTRLYDYAGLMAPEYGEIT